MSAQPPPDPGPVPIPALDAAAGQILAGQPFQVNVDPSPRDAWFKRRGVKLMIEDTEVGPSVLYVVRVCPTCTHWWQAYLDADDQAPEVLQLQLEQCQALDCDCP